MSEPEYPKHLVTYDFDGDNHASVIQLSAEHPDESHLPGLVAEYHHTTEDQITNLGVMTIG